jgi:hypothetical protein
VIVKPSADTVMSSGGVNQSGSSIALASEVMS